MYLVRCLVSGIHAFNGVIRALNIEERRVQYEHLNCYKKLIYWYRYTVCVDCVMGCAGAQGQRLY